MDNSYAIQGFPVANSPYQFCDQLGHFDHVCLVLFSISGKVHHVCQGNENLLQTF